MTWNHGGDWAGFEYSTGKRPLDFSASVSPLGMPEGARLAAAAALRQAGAYPDPLCRGLRNALSGHLGVPPEQILCGNGASDLIYRLALALRPKCALLTAPAFSEYEAALDLTGCRIRRFPLREDNGFLLEEAFLNQITPETDAVFLCNPNNPTGRTVEPGLLKRILERCGASGAWLILDECFLDFLEDPSGHTLLPELDGRRLLILRAFTKFYGMAGLRLGYCLCADTELLSRMARSGPPWPVSHPAQEAGIAALKETGYARRLRELIRTQRPKLAEGLEALGFLVVPGEAIFLLFYAGSGQLGEGLRRRGILIRDCRNFHGLGPGWYRIAVRTEKENAALLAAMREVTDGWQSGS